MTWHVGDRGRTKGHHRYRIIADDLLGNRGPLVAAVTIAEEEMVIRYDANGVHHGQHRVYDLQPAKDKA